MHMKKHHTQAHSLRRVAEFSEEGRNGFVECPRFSLWELALRIIFPSADDAAAREAKVRASHVVVAVEELPPARLFERPHLAEVGPLEGVAHGSRGAREAGPRRDSSRRVQGRRWVPEVFVADQEDILAARRVLHLPKVRGNVVDPAHSGIESLLGVAAKELREGTVAVTTAAAAAAAAAAVAATAATAAAAVLLLIRLLLLLPVDFQLAPRLTAS